MTFFVEIGPAVFRKRLGAQLPSLTLVSLGRSRFDNSHSQLI